MSRNLGYRVLGLFGTEKGMFFLNELTDTFGVQAVPPNRPLGLPPMSLPPETAPPPHPDIPSSPPLSKSRKEILPIRIPPEYFCTRNPQSITWCNVPGALESWTPQHNLSLDNSSSFANQFRKNILYSAPFSFLRLGPKIQFFYRQNG